MQVSSKFLPPTLAVSAVIDSDVSHDVCSCFFFLTNLRMFQRRKINRNRRGEVATKASTRRDKEADMATVFENRH